MTSMEALRAAVAAVAQDAGVRVPGSQAAEEAVELGDLITRLEGARLARLQVVQEEGAWALDGSRSATAWLARHSRSSRAVAGAQLKTARMLKALPITAAAVLAGSVPAEHAKAITRTCLRTPAMADQLAHPARGEAFLLDQAHLELDEYKKFLNSWAMRADPEAVDASYREDRDDYWLQVARTSDGVAIRGFLDPVCGESLITALDARAGARSATDTRDRPARLHDALAAILARVLDGGSLGVHNTVRPQVVVHVPWVTLKAEAGTAGLPPAWLQESGAPIPRRVLDRIACDSELTRVVFGPRGEVLDLGRSTRLFTKNQRRALDARDGECRWPGCHAPPEQTEAHHRIWWSRGGLTDLRDGLLACLYHHIYIHDHDVRIEHGTDGGLEFYVHNGPLIGVSYPRGGPDADPLPWPDAA